MTNFFLLQVNSHPLKSMKGIRLGFQRFPFISRPGLKNQADNFRIQYLGGAFGWGLTWSPQLAWCLIYWPQTYSSFCLNLLCAGPVIPGLVLSINLIRCTPLHIEDWALQGSRLTTGLSGSGCLANPTHCSCTFWYCSAALTSSNTSVRGKVFPAPWNAFGMTGSGLGGFDGGGREMQKVTSMPSKHVWN